MALIRMMQKKHINEIQIKDLVKVAGVSRSSFYRNFESKEDVLYKYAEKITLEVGTFPGDYTDITEYVLAKFRMVKREKYFFRALNKSNLVFNVNNYLNKYLIKGIVDEKMINNDEISYHLARIAGSSTGIIIEWINRDFKESEKELAEMFKDIVK